MTDFEDDDAIPVPHWLTAVIGALLLIPGLLFAAGGVYGMLGPPQKPFDGTAGRFLVFGGLAATFGGAMVGAALAGDRLYVGRRGRSHSSGSGGDGGSPGGDGGGASDGGSPT